MVAKRYSDRVLSPLVENSSIVKQEVYFPRNLICSNKDYNKQARSIVRTRSDLTKMPEETLSKGVILFEYEKSVTVQIDKGNLSGLQVVRKAYLLKKTDNGFEAMYPELNFAYDVYESM